MKRLRRGGTRFVGGVGAVAAGLSGDQASVAEVVFTLVDVDISDGINDPYRVDFDGDGINEFSIFADANNVHISKAWSANDPNNPDNFAQGAGVINTLDPNNSNRPANLALGTLIGPDDTFEVASRALTGRNVPGEGQPLGSGAPAGNFQVSHGPGYIGVRFQLSNNTHYGYVGYEGVGTENDAAGHVYALGYETTPDTPIAAGAGIPFINAGDYNNDGVVDAADYVVWRKNDGSNPQGYNTWRTNFGNTGGAAAGQWLSTATVPEPTSLALLAAGAACLSLYRRRRSAEGGLGPAHSS